MERIVNGVLKFQQDVYPRQKALFESLSTTQHPQALFIGCSDSRVVPELFTQQGPGDLFVVRQVGNIVPPYGATPNGVAASIEYAVTVLEVPDIVVCGHSGCGAMTAIQRGGERLKALPAVQEWLQFSQAAQDVVEERFAGEDARSKLNHLIRKNVVLQIANLSTHPCVASAVRARKVRLHGWVFDIPTGGVESYDSATGEFIPLDRGSV